MLQHSYGRLRTTWFIWAGGSNSGPPGLHSTLTCWIFSARLGVILRNLSFSFCWFPSRTPLLGLKLSRDSGQSSTRVSGSFWREDGSCFQNKCSEGILLQQCDTDVRSGTTARILTPKGRQSGNRRNWGTEDITEQLNPVTLDLWTASTALTAGTTLTWGLHFQRDNF